MKLTKAQRHTAYIIMLAEMNPSQYYAPYLCLITKNILHIYVDLWGDGFADIFPELWAKKPYTNSLIWFSKDDFGSRINLLKQCIEETYTAVK